MQATIEMPQPEDWQNGGFGLYLHWPFCAAKCPYCDFNSHVVAHIDLERWQVAYLSEIDRVADEIGNRILHSVFFGGGTPSLMPPDLVARIIDRVARRFRLRNDIEITLEANPTSSDAARFQAFARAGVNRFSLGLQALDDDALRKLGRLHSAAEGLKAFEAARNAVSKVSFDLIYARQDQTLAAWQAELAAALTLAPDHLSLYQLTIEDGTVFAERHRRGLLRGLPDEDLSAALYEHTVDACAAYGLENYEVSNFAKTGFESVHNLIYWRSGDFAGVGPGAHGRLTLDGARLATQTFSAPGAWLKAVYLTGSGEMPRERVPRLEQADELLLMGMRLSEGLDTARLERLAGQPLDEEKVQSLIASGHLWRNSTRIGATQKGRLVLNALLSELV
ncbi:MAG: radical SAM family heme chaperone HemW [Pararhodobacter sp.]